MNPKKILFISYYCHPKLLTATRNFYLSQFLAQLGYEVHMLTRPTDPLTAVKGIHYHYINAWDYRKILIKLGIRDGITSTLIKPGFWIRWGHKLLLKYPFNKWLGEGGGSYYIEATKKGIQIIDRYQITHVYSSYRPMSDHFIAEQLKIKYPALIWIGDFRDVLWWTKKDPHYQQAWIRNLIKRINHITAVTHGIGAFWGEVYKKPFTTIYNGLPLMHEQLNRPEETEKFIINYTGSIYTEFQRANVLFEVLNKMILEDEVFAGHVLIRYTGIHYDYWSHWMQEFGLLTYSQIDKQIPVELAWTNQAQAHINLLLTWTTKDISGFIHGKFNEYLAVRKPILCVIEGKRDAELEAIYQPLNNSIVVYNLDKESDKMKSFILHHYQTWKLKRGVDELQGTILSEYQWTVKARPLVELIQSST